MSGETDHYPPDCIMSWQEAKATLEQIDYLEKELGITVGNRGDLEGRVLEDMRELETSRLCLLAARWEYWLGRGSKE